MAKKNVAYVRPEVQDALPDWRRVADCVAGERGVKAAKTKYLPMPTGEAETAENRERYQAYLQRAVFYNVTGRTLDGLLGQVFSEESDIDLPDILARYQADIDGAGTGLEQQSKAALKAILEKGHGGLLVDFPTLADVATMADIEALRIRPRVLLIQPENIINWRVTVIGGESVLSLVVLSENANVSDDGFEYRSAPRWREIRLTQDDRQSPFVQVNIWKMKEAEQTISENEYEIEDSFLLRDFRGMVLDRIPFVFLGATNNEPQIDKAPLLDLANLNVAHYRNSADYEESCFLVGQPTPVFTGLTQSWVEENFKSGIRLGSRSAIPLPEGASATLLQATPNIMPKEAMRHKEEQMKALGAKLIEHGPTKGTATEALIEESSESSVLSSAAKNVSLGYQQALFFASRFVGDVNPEQIVFELNSDFAANHMTAQERAQLLTEWQAEGITWAEYRTALKKSGVAYMEDDEAKDMIDSQPAGMDLNNQNINV